MFELFNPEIEELLNEKFPDDIKDYSPATESSVISNISSSSSEAICNMIISSKVFGWKSVIPIAMKELASRRKNGEDFNYEDYIEKNKQEKITINPSDIKKISSQLTDIFNSKQGYYEFINK